MKMLCLVESDHGVNIMGLDRDYLVSRLSEGVDQGHVMLGGKYLPELKRDALVAEKRVKSAVKEKSSPAN